MYPRLFEAIMFLKVNRDLWKVEDVVQALLIASEERSAQRRDKHTNRLEKDRVQAQEIEQDIETIWMN